MTDNLDYQSVRQGVQSGKRASHALAIISVALGSAAIGLFMLNDRLAIRGNLGLAAVAVVGLLGLGTGIIARILARKIQVVALVGIILSLVEIVASFGLLIVNRRIQSSLPNAKGLAHKAMCQQNLRSLGSGMSFYCLDHHGAPTDLSTLIAAGLADPMMLECPAAHSGRPTDYFYDPLFVPPMTTTQPDPMAMVMCDFKGNHPDGSRSVLYADGHTKCLSEQEFAQQLALPQNAAFAAALHAAEGP